jgi:hypothetical protein
MTNNDNPASPTVEDVVASVRAVASIGRLSTIEASALYRAITLLQSLAKDAALAGAVRAEIEKEERAIAEWNREYPRLPWKDEHPAIRRLAVLKEVFAWRDPPAIDLARGATP